MEQHTGHRETDGDGRVLHFRFGALIACKTKGDNRQATPVVKDVNCLKCLAIIKRIRA